MIIDGASIFVKSLAVASRRVENETVIIKAERFPKSDHENRIMRYLNKTGSVIWELIDGTRSVNSMMKVIVEKFDVDAEIIEKDVKDFLGDLTEDQLIVSQKKSSSPKKCKKA